MGKSAPQTSTVVQESGLSAEDRQYLYGPEGLAPRAKALSEQPLNLPDYQVAGFSQPQMQAFNVAQSGIGGYMPALSQGFQATQGGIGAAGQALGIVPAALSAAQPYQTGAAATGYGATQGYNPMAGYQGYMNPYMDEVVRQSEADIARQGQMQAQGIRSQAVGQGAFGGSRQAVAERELGRNVAEQQARTSSGLRAQGFEQAQQQAQQSFEQQQQRQGQFAQVLGNLGTAYGQLGLQGAGQLGALGQGLGSLGGQMAGLGELGQQLNIRDVGTLMDVGTAQQAQSQAGLDALRQNQYQRTMSPYQQLGFFSDLFRGMPLSQTQTTTTSAPGPNAITQTLGTGLGLYGMYKDSR
jgi:hypothetical protein